MQSNPRTLVNVLVISVRIPANPLVKLTKLGQGGHGGGLLALSSSYSCSMVLLRTLLRGWTKALGTPVRPSVERNTTQGGEIDGYPCTTFDLVGLSWDDTWSLVRIISKHYPINNTNNTSTITITNHNTNNTTNNDSSSKSDQVTCNLFCDYQQVC